MGFYYVCAIDYNYEEYNASLFEGENVEDALDKAEAYFSKRNDFHWYCYCNDNDGKEPVKEKHKCEEEKIVKVIVAEKPRSESEREIEKLKHQLRIAYDGIKQLSDCCKKYKIENELMKKMLEEINKPPL